MIKNRRIGCYLLVMTLFSLSSYWFLLKRSHQSDLYCSGVGSMRTIANNMIQMSSPVNSSSWHTTRRILLGAKRHNATVNCFLPGIFTPLYGNIKRMMSDIGITTALREYKVQDRPRFHLDRKLQPNRLHNYFVLETSFYAGKHRHQEVYHRKDIYVYIIKAIYICRNQKMGRNLSPCNSTMSPNHSQF